MPRLKMALGVLLSLMIAGLLALSITVAVLFKLYPIHTGSMIPTLSLRSLAVVEKGAPYHQGDIITFHHRTLSGHDEVVTHRYIKRDNNGLIVTKGDANSSPDAWPIRDQDVIGKVVVVIPQAGYWLVWLENPSGLCALLLVGFAIWLLWLELRRKPSVATP